MGIGSQEILLILFFALIFFGANKIPGIARGLGKGLAEFRKAVQDIRREITREAEASDQMADPPSISPPRGPELTSEADKGPDEAAEAP